MRDPIAARVPARRSRPSAPVQPAAPDPASPDVQPFDIVIANGHVVDGTGSPWYAADVGIRDGRIAAIGRLAGAAAKQTIDAPAASSRPGFIDMLGQSELTVLVEPTLPSKIFQGITTELTGEGGSAAPLERRDRQGRQGRLRPPEDHAGLAHLRAVLRARREAGARHQHGAPRRRDAGAAHGARRRRQAADARRSWIG